MNLFYIKGLVILLTVSNVVSTRLDFFLIFISRNSSFGFLLKFSALKQIVCVSAIILHLSPPFTCCSSQAAVNTRWCCRTSLRVRRVSWVCTQDRRWRCWSARAIDLAGVWCASQSARPLRRDSYPAARCRSRTRAAASTWIAFSPPAKVGVQKRKPCSHMAIPLL